jgi:Ni,Fe-hydrogenase maturation factor
LYWTKNSIFKKAFYNYLFNYNTNLLFIDATSINNKYGSENIVINPEYKKKKVTKISVVSNNKNFIHSIEVFDLKTKNVNYNTAVHDSKMIEKSLKNIKIKNKSKHFYLLGD